KQSLASFITRVAEAADEGRTALEARLQDRVREISLDLPVDEAMIAQEILRTVQRSDISEEVTRFRAHLSHWDALTDGPEPCGRKLDFLLQEMNREVNTIGSKADGLRVSELIINAKAELEKMREQVQNIEEPVRLPSGAAPRQHAGPAGFALHGLGAVGDGQDNAGRAPGAPGSESVPVAVVYLADRPSRRA